MFQEKKVVYPLFGSFGLDPDLDIVNRSGDVRRGL
jgi:hypothetical protein